MGSSRSKRAKSIYQINIYAIKRDISASEVVKVMWVEPIVMQGLGIVIL